MTYWPFPLTPEEEEAVNEVNDRLPALMYIRQMIENDLRWPDLRVVLPRRVHRPFTFRGEEGPRATVMGLPVMWSEHEEWGVMVALSETKENN